MEWRVAATTFVAIFLAELGDKTQLATLTFSAAAKSRWSVFAGAALALVLTTAIAVALGDAVTRVVSPKVLHRIAAVGFLVLGTWMLLRPD